MAKVLERPRDLYDADLLAWLEQHLGHLRAGHLDRLDIAHLIEELEAMAGSQRRELESRLEVLLMHMLKLHAQLKRRSRSWHSTIVEQRARIGDLLEQCPSLRNGLMEVAESAFAVAVRRTVIETGLKRSAFPATLPYALPVILDDEPDAALNGR